VSCVAHLSTAADAARSQTGTTIILGDTIQFNEMPVREAISIDAWPPGLIAT